MERRVSVDSWCGSVLSAQPPSLFPSETAVKEYLMVMQRVRGEAERTKRIRYHWRSEPVGVILCQQSPHFLFKTFGLMLYSWGFRGGGIKSREKKTVQESYYDWDGKMEGWDLCKIHCKSLLPTGRTLILNNSSSVFILVEFRFDEFQQITWQGH